MGLELKRSRVQHTVFTVSRHSHKWCLPNERMAAVGARMTPCGPCECNCSAAVAVAAIKDPAMLCHGMDPCCLHTETARVQPCSGVCPQRAVFLKRLHPKLPSSHSQLQVYPALQHKCLKSATYVVVNPCNAPIASMVFEVGHCHTSTRVDVCERLVRNVTEMPWQLLPGYAYAAQHCDSSVRQGWKLNSKHGITAGHQQAMPGGRLGRRPHLPHVRQSCPCCASVDCCGRAPHEHQPPEGHARLP